MTLPVPPAATPSAMASLSERLAVIGDELAELLAALPQVNDPDLQNRVRAFAALGERLVAAHADRPGPDIADALAGLLAAARGLHVPSRDPDLGALPSLRLLRAPLGLIIMAVSDALDAAETCGSTPSVAALRQDLSVTVPRAGNEDLLRAIARRLDEVGKQVEALDTTRVEATNFVQQTGLLNLYLPAMRVEIDLAKLHLSVGGVTIDFGALARAVEAMTELTGDFMATVQAWKAYVSEQVTRAAEAVRIGVRKVRVAVRAATRVMRWRRSDKAAVADSVAAPVSPGPPGDPPPPDFSLDVVKEMILTGEAPPLAWRPLITELDLSSSRLRRLHPLTALTALQSLDLRDTEVSDVTPLATLAALQSLNLRDTGVSDAAPLAALTTLHSLDLGDTHITDVAALSALTALQNLNLMGTPVNDIAPLAALTALQSLNLTITQVSDLAPLAALTALQDFDLMGTQVSDVAPLASLTALQSLNLAATRISDVAPLAALTALQSLDLSITQVSDLMPLAALTALQRLDLMGTQVSDVAPLAGLNSPGKPRPHRHGGQRRDAACRTRCPAKPQPQARSGQRRGAARRLGAAQWPAKSGGLRRGLSGTRSAPAVASFAMSKK